MTIIIKKVGYLLIKNCTMKESNNESNSNKTEIEIKANVRKILNQEKEALDKANNEENYEECFYISIKIFALEDRLKNV